MEISEGLDPLSELFAIKARYELSYEELARELENDVGLTGVGIFKVFSRGYTHRSTLTAIEVWLERSGRKKYPLPGRTGGQNAGT